jgi:hypothetical protein
MYLCGIRHVVLFVWLCYFIYQYHQFYLSGLIQNIGNVSFVQLFKSEVYSDLNVRLKLSMCFYFVTEHEAMKVYWRAEV